jgi:hypothetical protein
MVLPGARRDESAAGAFIAFACNRNRENAAMQVYAEESFFAPRIEKWRG